MKLADKDISTINYEKRAGFVFSGLVLSYGGFFNLLYLCTSPNLNWIVLFVADLLMVGVSFLISYFMNRKFNKDLNAGSKNITLEKIQHKENQTVYEAGSGCLYIPILGDIFPKLWGQNMRAIQKWNLIINNFRYEVEKELFDKVKESDFVEMHHPLHSDLLLDIQIVKNVK